MIKKSLRRQASKSLVEFVNQEDSCLAEAGSEQSTPCPPTYTGADNLIQFALAPQGARLKVTRPDARTLNHEP
jgi:hypothetical protein